MMSQCSEGFGEVMYRR